MPQFLLTKMDAGPADLDDELPLLAVAVRRLRGPHRVDHCLARLLSPIKYHVPSSFDLNGVQPHLRGSDDDGDFLWIYAIVVGPRSADDRFHSGMTNLAVSVAYVIDQTQTLDEELRPEKLEQVGHGYLSDAPVAPAEAGRSREYPTAPPI